MFSLRKRAKLEATLINLDNISSLDDDDLKLKLYKQTNYVKSISHQASCFIELPIEILYAIMDKLALKDKLKLRLLNKSFKSLVDTYELMWTDLCFSLNVDNYVDLSSFRKFLLSKPNMNHLRLSCPIFLNKQMRAFLVEDLNNNNNNNPIAIEDDSKRKLNENSLENANVWFDTNKLSVHVKCINILSLNLLNLFSTNCFYLTIESFINTHGNQVRSTRCISQMTSLEMAQMAKLESFDICCLLFDQKVNQLYIWNNVFSENVLLNRSSEILANLREMHLRFYMDSSKYLLKSLASLEHLTHVEFEFCNPIDDICDYDLSRLTSMPKIRSLQLNNVSSSFALLMLERLANKSDLNTLGLFVKPFYFPQMDLNISKQEQQMRQMFRILGSFESLESLSTNLWHVSASSTNDLMAPHQPATTQLNIPHSLKHLSLVEQPAASRKQASRKRFRLIDASLNKFDLRDFNLAILNAANLTEPTKLCIQFNLNCEQVPRFGDALDLLMTRIGEKFVNLEELDILIGCLSCLKETGKCQYKKYATDVRSRTIEEYMSECLTDENIVFKYSASALCKTPLRFHLNVSQT